MINLFAYDMVAIIGSLLIVYVMQKADSDNVLEKESIYLRVARRFSFLVMALVTLWTVYDMHQNGGQPTLPIIILLGAGDFLLLINAISLHRRAPPEPWHGRGTRQIVSGIRLKKPN